MGDRFQGCKGDRFIMRTRVFGWVSGHVRVMGVDGCSGDRVDMRRGL